jgi:hypothetical protein
VSVQPTGTPSLVVPVGGLSHPAVLATGSPGRRLAAARVILRRSTAVETGPNLVVRVGSRLLPAPLPRVVHGRVFRRPVDAPASR